MVPLQEANLEAAFKGAGPWQLFGGSLGVATQPEQPGLPMALLPPPKAAAAPLTVLHTGAAGTKNSTAAAICPQVIPAHWGSQAEQDTSTADPVGIAVDALVMLARCNPALPLHMLHPAGTQSSDPR